MTTTRNTLIRMTNDATGEVTYVTSKDNAKARGKGHRYPDDRADGIAAEFAKTNPGYSFTTELA